MGWLAALPPPLTTENCSFFLRAPQENSTASSAIFQSNPIATNPCCEQAYYRCDHVRPVSNRQSNDGSRRKSERAPLRPHSEMPTARHCSPAKKDIDLRRQDSKAARPSRKTQARIVPKLITLVAGRGSNLSIELNVAEKDGTTVTIRSVSC